jgi:hypothetical protein
MNTAALAYGTAELALVYPSNGAAPVGSALVWREASALVRCPDGITIWLNIARADGVPLPTLPTYAILDQLRFEIFKRLQYCDNAAVKRELEGKYVKPEKGPIEFNEDLWLRAAGQGAQGKERTLRVHVRHHVAYHALAIALLHAPSAGIKCQGVAYHIRLHENDNILMALLQRNKGKASETELIASSFKQAQFPLAKLEPSFIFELCSQSTGITPDATRWYVALCSGASPLTPATCSLWPAGTRAYERGDGRFKPDNILMKAFKRKREDDLLSFCNAATVAVAGDKDPLLVMVEVDGAYVMLPATEVAEFERARASRNKRLKAETLEELKKEKAQTAPM